MALADKKDDTYAGDDTGDSAKDYNSKTSFGFTL
jgi:hypothetical protein